MRIRFLAPLLLLTAAAPAPSPEPTRLRADVEAMVGFGTRHTLSSATDPKRGIGAARAWAAERFRSLGEACAACVTVEAVSDRFAGPRAPDGVIVENVLGIQRGTSEPQRVIIIQAHIDSRVSDVMNATADAPGANDNASGVALVMETARILSREKLPVTIVYAALSGEEQGLWGGQLLARTARARGWQVVAVLNNDIVGNTRGIGGARVDSRVRVFSESLSAAADLAAAKAVRANGGEDDGLSRALAKAVRRIAAREKGLDVLMVRRPDRFQRGGDHTPFLELGFPAVRFTEAVENYDHQHQDLRTEDGKFYGDTVAFMDFPYLAKVTALNVAVARELARAPAAPAQVTIAGALSDDTTVRWSAVPNAAAYRVRWRRADQQDWTDSRDVPAPATSLKLPHVNIDDHFFGVSALAVGGSESLVTFAGPAPRRP